MTSLIPLASFLLRGEAPVCWRLRSASRQEAPMKANRPVSRRSFFATVGSATIGAGVVVLLPSQAAATDHDSGAHADPGATPAHPAHHATSDNDRGAHA